MIRRHGPLRPRRTQDRDPKREVRVILDKSVELTLADEAETGRLGQALAGLLRIGDAVLLSGPLGAGKSTLARALIRALTTPDESVPSPTFTLVQAYEAADLTVAHFDLYRIERPDDLDELGFDEALDEGAAIVEWPQRLGTRLPRDRLAIELARCESGEAEDGRIARIEPFGSWKGRVLEW